MWELTISVQLIKINNTRHTFRYDEYLMKFEADNSVSVDGVNSFAATYFYLQCNQNCS
jgi:hypothetical protein